jgi:FkbM family methyltransferase
VLPPVIHDLLREIQLCDTGPDLDDNVDFTRFPDGMPETTAEQAQQVLAELVRHGSGFQVLHDRLADAADRRLLATVLAYRVLGPRRVQLPMTAVRQRELIEQVRSARVAESTAALGIYDWRTDDFDLARLGYPLRVRTVEMGIVQTFLVDQYRCAGEPDIAVRPGDVAIDGGACLGDTSLHFAHLAGESGRVVAYEFEPHNLELLEQNLALNPELAGRIDVRRAALWDCDGAEVAFRPFGPASAIVPDGESRTTTETIDGLVERGVVDRIDFIKLDIEGAELHALQGARESLHRFRPRLAIAAYHKLDDLAVLPSYLADVGVGYRFRLGHTTMHHEETVLFARAD